MIGFSMPRAALLAVGAFTLAVSSAEAGSVQFSFGGTGATNLTAPGSVTDARRPTLGMVPFGDAWTQTQSDTDGTVTLTITADAFTRGAAGLAGAYTIGAQSIGGIVLGDNPRDDTALITQSADGLGIMNNGSFVINDNRVTDDTPFEVDGSSGGSFGTGWFDFLVLETDREVQFENVTFSQFGGTDRFRLIIDENNDGIVGNDGDFLTAAFGAGATSDQFSPFAGLTGTRVGIAAVSSGSAWRLQSLELSFDAPVDTPPLAPMPLPGSAWLMLAGLGAMGLWARRRA